METELIKMAVISALVGGLLGVERELKVQVIAGTRTFMLISLAGALSTYIAVSLSSPWFVNVTLLGVVLLVLLLGTIKNFRTYDIGLTTPVAFLLAYLIGVLVGLGMYTEAVGAGILVTSILVFKKYTLILSEALSHDEMRSAMEFGLIAFVLYPVVPPYPVDPAGLLNLKQVVVAVLVASTAGFAGFLALRFLEERLGAVEAGFAGGLVSSAGVAGSVSKLGGRTAAACTLAALAAEVVKNAAVAAFISLELAYLLLLPAAALLVCYALPAVLLGREAEGVELEMRSPFALMPALRFTLILLALILVYHYLSPHPLFLYLAAAAAGVLSGGASLGALAVLSSSGTLGVSTAALGGVLTLAASGLRGALLLGGRARSTALLLLLAGSAAAVLLLILYR